VRQPLRHNLTAAQAVNAMRRRMGKADEHRAAADGPASCGMISISTLSGIAKKSFSSGRDSPGILCRREIRDGGFYLKRAFEIR
jgi:hypothetical protein